MMSSLHKDGAFQTLSILDLILVSAANKLPLVDKAQSQVVIQKTTVL
jgi:hypothetical protein